MSWLGLDIGGANLKAANGRGWARTVPFPLWRNPEGLTGAVAALIDSAPPAERIALTMTGELCDCYRTKAAGVQHILKSVHQAAAERDVRVYLLDGTFVPIKRAYQLPQLAAASNWHALAQFACRFSEGRVGLLIDVGSTTTDIVPLVEGVPCAEGLADTDRLMAGGLIYTGVGRTPVCAVTRSLPWRGRECPVAAELFASAADAHVILGNLPERPADNWTADGRPMSKEYARERLARMICADASIFSWEDAERAAIAVRDAQVALLRAGLRQVLATLSNPPTSLVLSGMGEFLAREAAQEVRAWPKIARISAELTTEASAAAPAHAVAVLAREGTAI
jgi:(4-(4-[2-(gamma-L-glutamylamino)ethyl]phenoxymethyl)furan-2-yl)methanamine synthase